MQFVTISLIYSARAFYLFSVLHKTLRFKNMRYPIKKQILLYTTNPFCRKNKFHNNSNEIQNNVIVVMRDKQKIHTLIETVRKISLDAIKADDKLYFICFLFA